MAVDFSRKHAEYRDRSEIWKYNRAHLAGGRVLSAGGFLTRFQLESNEGYASRKTRARGLFDNLGQRAIQVYLSQLYKEDVARDLPSRIERFEDDVDLEGTEADEFFLAVGEDAHAAGVAFVLVDSPPAQTDLDGNTVTESEADRLRLRRRPWLEHVPAENVIDWDIEQVDTARRGQLNWVVIHDTVTRKPMPFADPVEVKRWRVIAPGAVIVFEQRLDDPAPLEVQRSGSLSQVPLVPFYAQRLGPMRGRTVLDDVALAANALWQASSVRDEGFQFHGFNQLVYETESDVSSLKLGEKRALPIRVGEKLYYLSPSATPFSAYESIAKEIRERVADLVFARTSRQKDTAQVESAEKRELDRAEFVALLKRKALSMQGGEQRCWEFVEQFFGATSEQARESVTIAYNTDFQISDREIADWVQGITEGIWSRPEVYQVYHPQLTLEEAEAAVVENLKLEEKLRPLTRMEDAIGAQLDAQFGTESDTAGDSGSAGNGSGESASQAA